MGRSSRRQESTAVLCCALILLASPSQARKKAATLDDRSDACRACKRIGMDPENAMVVHSLRAEALMAECGNPRCLT